MSEQTLLQMLEAGIRKQARREAMEEAVIALHQLPHEYSDGPSMHVETMTIGRAVVAIRKLMEQKDE